MWNLNKRFSAVKTALLALLLCAAAPAFADKYAGEIFHFGSGIRNLALGNTGLTNLNSASIAWWNPALLAEIENSKLELMHAEEYSGLLKYDSFSAVWAKKKKFALTISRIAINDIPLTALEDEDLPIGNDNRPYAYDNVNNSDLVAFFGFCQHTSFAEIGFTPKIAWRSLAQETAFGFGADISFIKRINQNILLAAQIRDFFTTRIIWSNGTDEYVLPNANIELNYNYSLPIPYSHAAAYLRTEIFFEGRDEAAAVSLDPLSADFHCGVEYFLNSNLTFLLGYSLESPSCGISLSYNQFELVYAFALQTQLDNSHRIALSWTF